MTSNFHNLQSFENGLCTLYQWWIQDFIDGSADAKGELQPISWSNFAHTHTRTERERERERQIEIGRDSP